MKTFYIMILFLLTFQFCILSVGALGIFPYGFYSDMDSEQLAEQENPQQVLVYLFTPDDGVAPSWFVTGSFTILALLGVFLLFGVLAAIRTQNYLIITICVLGFIFVPMVVKSYGFFQQLFSYGNSQSIIYIGLVFGITILVTAVVTIIEIPAQGRS